MVSKLLDRINVRGIMKKRDPSLQYLLPTLLGHSNQLDGIPVGCHEAITDQVYLSTGCTIQSILGKVEIQFRCFELKISSETTVQVMTRQWSVEMEGDCWLVVVL